MKKNYFTKKPKRFFIAFLVLFCGLFANIATAQTAYTWNGAVDGTGDWATAANWSPSGVPGGNAGDSVSISNGANVTLSSGTVAIARLTISNATGAVTGSTLTISSGATLNLESTTVNVVTLTGGNIVNNGTLSVKSTNTGIDQGILCTTPTQTPGTITEYGYSGNGNLTIDISAAAGSASVAIVTTSLGLTTAYKFLLNSSTTTFLLSSTATSTFGFRAVGTTSACSPLIIGGTGVKLGTTAVPVFGSLMALSNANKVTVNSGTTLEINTKTGNLVSGLTLANASATGIGTPTTLTNNGIINILGETLRSGIQVTTNSVTAGDDLKIIINNQGTINVDITANGPAVNTNSMAAYAINIGTGVSNATGAFVDFNNNGTVTLRNRSNLQGTGFAVWGNGGGQTASTNLNNNGTFNMISVGPNNYQRFFIINNGTYNTNNAFNPNRTSSNSASGVINFLQPEANFAVLAAVSATAGAVYKDANNNEYTVLATKAGTGTRLYASMNLIAAAPGASGSLTLFSGTGDATIAFTGTNIPTAAISASAVLYDITNNGIVNTYKGLATVLNQVPGISDLSTGTISPGGTDNKGIATYSARTASALNQATTPIPLRGTLKIQVAGNTAAGVDYDKVVNTVASSGFDITAATLDLTGISGTATPVEIMSTNGGTITGPFASVIGLTSGWSVDYSDTSKVQLVYTATTWNGTAWSNGTPDATKDAIIDGDLSSTGTLNTKNLTVNNTRTLTVASGTVTVAEALVNNGTITVANNANLRQTAVANTNSGSGTTTVNRNSAALKRLDYTMWSSPVSGSQTLEGFSPNTSRVPNRFYTYNGGTAFTNIATTSTFTPGMGYLIRMPNDASTSPTEYAGQFTGTTFNNGTITVSGLTSDRYYSVGNPYPSTLDADAFLTANPGTLYFWRKTNGAVGGAYATYNSVGPVAAASGAGSEVPNGTIQVGQGFIAKTGMAATSLIFTNAMRLGTASSQFFKTKNTVAKSRVWLDLTDTGGLFSQALVGYLDGATLGVDNGYDGKYLSDSATDAALTSIVDGGEYTIQGRPAFDATDVVALGFKAGAAGDFTIAVSKKDGALATQDIYLVDSKTGIETDLNAGSYTFAAEAGVDNTRFSLKYQKTLKVIDAALDNNSVSVYLNDGAIHINSKSAAINSVKVFDVQGRLLAEQRNVNANTAVISNLRAKNQILIVNVVGEDNSEVSKKIMN